MNPNRFDRIATLFAARRLNRRRAVQHGAAGFATMALAAGPTPVPPGRLRR